VNEREPSLTLSFGILEAAKSAHAQLQKNGRGRGWTIEFIVSEYIASGPGLEKGPPSGRGRDPREKDERAGPPGRDGRMGTGPMEGGGYSPEAGFPPDGGAGMISGMPPPGFNSMPHQIHAPNQQPAGGKVRSYGCPSNKRQKNKRLCRLPHRYYS
jgi:hypothetical protein